MSTHPTVPSDVEAESIIDLVHDCREISGVLGSFVPTVVRIPEARGALPVEISPDAVNALIGYDDYGS
jgi:hypothetical protein